MIKLEYIWIDGAEPTQQLRSKTKVINIDNFSINSEVPEWSFDGSSTNQAPGENSDCVLKPIRLYENPLETDCYLVLCEVWNTDGTAHTTNHRYALNELNNEYSDEDVWVGIEQEYTLFQYGRPLGWPPEEAGIEPAPQGDYYCG